MALFLALLATAAVAAAPPAYKAPRNAFGQPDFEGVWTNASLTSLERPANFKSLTIPEAQAKTAEQARAKVAEEIARAIEVKQGRRCPTCSGKVASTKLNGYFVDRRCGGGHTWTSHEHWTAFDPATIARSHATADSATTGDAT